MKILMIFQAAPLPPPLDMGSAKRNFPFLRENIKRHDVWVLSFGSEEEEQLFRKYYGNQCKGVRFVKFRRHRIVNLFRRLYLLVTGQSTFRMMHRQNLQRAIDQITTKEKFDLIHCCLANAGYYRFPQGVPLVGDTHNVEYDLVYRIYQQAKNIFWKAYCYTAYKTGKRDEIRNLNKFDAVITTTHKDFDTFRQDLPDKRMYIIQNGVDPMFFNMQHVIPEPKTMIFMGLMSWYPNVHAIQFFLDEIFPKILLRVPDARLIIVGANPSKKLQEQASKNITITGFVDDVRPYVARGQIFIIPLLIGSGIRGKALEAMAMKIPIISTTLGCAGIHLKNEESALFADTPETFADAVIRLFDDPKLRVKLAENAYNIVREQYDWIKKGEELEQVYQTVLKNVGVGTSKSFEKIFVTTDYDANKQKVID